MGHVNQPKNPPATVTTQTKRTIVREITEVETIEQKVTVTRPDRYRPTGRPVPPAVDQPRRANLEPLARMALKSIEGATSTTQGWQVGKQMLTQMDQAAHGQNQAVKFGLIGIDASSSDTTDYRAAKLALEAVSSGRDVTDRDLGGLAVRMMEGSSSTSQGWKVGVELARQLERTTADPGLQAHLRAAIEAVAASSSDTTDYNTLHSAFQAVASGQTEAPVDLVLARAGLKAMDSATSTTQGWNVGREYLQQIMQETGGQSWAAHLGLKAMEVSSSDTTDYRAGHLALEAISQGRDRSLPDQAQLALRMMDGSTSTAQGWKVGEMVARHIEAHESDPTVRMMAQATLQAVQASSSDTTDFRTLKEFFQSLLRY